MADTSKLILAVDSSDVRKASGDLDKMAKAGGQAEKSAGSLAGAFKGLGALIGAATIVKLGRDFISLADASSNLSARLSLVTRSTAELAKVQNDLFQISQKTRTGFKETADLYGNLYRATQSLGVSQKQVAGVTETINKALIVSGTSAQGAAAALVQLGQGFASGVLRGEELNSVMEQAPRLAKAIADGLGISIGQLRKFGQEGKLTAEAVFGALEKSGAAVNSEFGKIPLTVGGAMTQAQNSMLSLVGTIDQATGATSSLAEAISGAAFGMSDLAADIKRAAAGAEDVGILAAAFQTISETVRVLGANVKFVFQGIGREIAAVLAQIGLVVTAIFSSTKEAASKWRQFNAISEAVKEDGKRAREELDKFESYVFDTSKRIQDELNNPYRLEGFATIKSAPQETSAAAIKEKISAADRYLESLRNQLNSLKDLSETEKLLEEIQLGRLGKLKPAQQDALLALARSIDLRKAETEQLKHHLEFEEKAAKQRVADAAVKNQIAEDAFSADEKGRLAIEAQIKFGREYLDQVVFEAQALRMTNTEREVAIALRNLEAQGIGKGSAAYEGYAEAIRNAVVDREAIKESIKQAKQIEDEWKKAAEQIEQSLTDSLYRAFESGKDFFSTFWQGIKNTIQTTVLKPVIQAVVGGTLGGVGGVANAASGASGLAGLAGIGGTLGSFGATGIMSTLTGTGLGTSLGAASSLIGTGSTAGGIGLGLGALAPYVAAAAALYSIFGKSKTPHVGGYALSDQFGAITDITAQQGGKQQAESQSAVGEMASLVSKLLNSAERSFGGAGDLSVRSVFEADGEDASSALFHILRGGEKQLGSFDAVGQLTADAAKGFDEFTHMAAESVRDALQAMDIPEWGSEMLEALGESPGLEKIAETVDVIIATQKALDGLRNSLGPLGLGIALLSDVSDESLIALADVAGGLDALKSGLTAYYANFFSDTERASFQMQAIGEILAGVGVEVPATREAFRSLVEAQDLTTESGMATYAALLSVSGAFAELVPAAEAAAGALSAAVLDAIDANIGLFQTREQSRRHQFGTIARSLIDSGAFQGTTESDLASVLAGVTKQQVYDFAESFVLLGDVSEEAKIAVIEAAGALAAMADDAAEAAHDLAVADIEKQLQAITDTFGDLSVVDDIETLSDAFVRNRDELRALETSLNSLLGTTAKTVQETLADMLASQRALQGFRSQLAQSIDDTRIRGMTPQERVAAYKDREASLFSELKTSNDPTAVAQRLQATIIARIKEEAGIRQQIADQSLTAAELEAGFAEQSRDAQIAALKEQISGAQRLQKLAEDIAQFTGSLKFSDLSPRTFAQQFADAQSLFDKALTGAQAGDEDAQSNLTGNARAYLEEARAFYGGSGQAYSAIFEGVLAGLEGFDAPTDPQLEALENQLTALQTLNESQIDTSADEVAALMAIDAALAEREAKNQAAIDTQIELARDQVATLKQTVTNQEAQIRQQAAIAEGLTDQLEVLNENFDRFIRNADLVTSAP